MQLMNIAEEVPKTSVIVPKNAQEGHYGISARIQGLGVAIKAAGIGLFLRQFAILQGCCLTTTRRQ